MTEHKSKQKTAFMIFLSISFVAFPYVSFSTVIHNLSHSYYARSFGFSIQYSLISALFPLSLHVFLASSFLSQSSNVLPVLPNKSSQVYISTDFMCIFFKFVSLFVAPPLSQHTGSRDFNYDFVMLYKHGYLVLWTFDEV